MLDNLQSAAFDSAILAIAKDLFGKMPRLSKCFSYVNYCVVLSFDDATTDRVIKFTNKSRRDIEIELHLYPPLRAHGLPVPEIEFTHLDYSQPSVPFIVMPKFSDYTLKDLCCNNHQAAMRACRASGQFIRELDERFTAAFKSFQTKDDLREPLAAIQQDLDHEPDLGLIREQEPELAQIIDQHLAPLSKPTPKRLTHGQPHTRNILADQHGEICVVDFATVGISSPLKDLCILLNSHDGWSKGTGDPAQRSAILKGYGELNEADIQALHFLEFFYWVSELRFYLSKVHGPECTPFAVQQSREIIAKVRMVADGKGLIDAL